ncbi:hypothetical protein Tco_0758948 [Tanacetum coccineum]
MSGPVELNLTPPTSAVRNTAGKMNEQISKNPNGPASDVALWEYCDKHYHQLLPIIAEKVHREKHSESRTPNVRGEHRRGRRSGRSRSMSGSPERTSVFSRIRRDRSESPRHRPERKEKRGGGVFNRLGDKGKSVSAHSKGRYQSYHSDRTESIPKKGHHERSYSRKTELLSESEDSGGGHWKSKSKRHRSASRIQWKSTISSKEKVNPRKISCKGSKPKAGMLREPQECMRISGFMHEITNPELIKRLHDNIPKSVEEMMRITAAFLRGEVAASNQARKKAFPTWKQQESGRKQNFDRKGDF